jgi:hypothetical protein
MADFQAGDRVILNEGSVATLTFFDRDLNRFVAEIKVGGSVNTLAGTISTSSFRLLTDDQADAAEDHTPGRPQRDPQGNVGPLDDEVFEDAHGGTSKRVPLDHHEEEAE